jgi:hypothetical protein
MKYVQGEYINLDEHSFVITMGNAVNNHSNGTVFIHGEYGSYMKIKMYVGDDIKTDIDSCLIGLEDYFEFDSNKITIHVKVNTLELPEKIYFVNKLHKFEKKMNKKDVGVEVYVYYD